MFRAAAAPVVLAATAVLTFARVAVYIPIYPATPEQAAPRKNAIAVPDPKPKYKATMTTKQKTANLLYSLAIKTIAPR